jgi:hypothetical protein
MVINPALMTSSIRVKPDVFLPDASGLRTGRTAEFFAAA